ncbi:hypothetical protein QOT17_007147 [Balamuthia mandrillaris]
MGACGRSSGALAVLLVFLGWTWVLLLLRVGVPVSEAAPLPHEQQPQMGFEEEAEEEQESERGGEASRQEGMAMPKQTSSLPPSQQGESLPGKMEEVGEKEGENKNEEEERRSEEQPQKEEAEEQEAEGEAQEREDQGVWVTVTADVAEADGQPQPQQGESRGDEEGELSSSVSASTQEQVDAGERNILLSMKEAAEEEEQREPPQQQEEELDQSKLQQQLHHEREETVAKIKGEEEEPEEKEEEEREGEKEEIETKQQQQQRPTTATTRSNNNNQSHNKEEAKEEAAIGESKEVAATATTPSVPECPTEGDKSKKPKEVIPPLEEWKDKIKSDMEKKEGPGHHHNNKDGKGQQGKKNKNFLSILTERYSNQFNYASEECGAKVLASSPEFQGTSNVLKDAMDVYSMSPCESTKWMVLELCEEIGINALEISNLESFSSTFKEFRVLGSHKWPTTKWVPIGGNFTAQDVRKIQLFTLEEPVWFKYLKFQFLSHYGNQYYCPVTSIRVHGINHVSDLKQKIKQNSQEVNEWTERLKNSEVTDSPSIDKELILSEKEELQTPPNAIYHETHSSASQEEAAKKKSSLERENELGGNSVIEEVIGVVDAEDILLNNRSALLSENNATQFGTNTTTTGDHTKEKQEEVVVPFELPSSPSPLPEQVIINSSSAMSPSETSSSPSAEIVFTQVQANGIEEQKDSTPSTNIQNLERHQSTDVDEHEETGDLLNGDEVQRQLNEGAAMQQKSKDKEDTLQISTKDSEIEKEDGKEEKEFPSRNDENIISRDSETQPATEKDIYFHEIINTTSSPLILDPPLNTQLEEDVNKVEESEERTVKNNETMTNKDNAEQVLMEVTINEKAAQRLNEEGNKESDRGKMEEKTEQEQKKEEIQIGKGGDEKAEQIQNGEVKRKQEEEKLEKDKKQKDEETSAEQEQADPKNQKQQQQPTITTQQEETSKKIGKKEEEGKENIQQHQRGEEMKVEEKEMEVEVEVEEEFSELELLMMDDSDGEMEELSAGESVFTTLANRMKELEINQSLSNRYLEKVSSRYVESYNELMEELERYSSERALLISLVNDLSKNTSNLEAQLLHNVQQMVDDRVSIATEVLLLEFQDRIDQMQQSFAEERNELLLFMFVAVVIAFFFLHYFHLIMVEAFHYVNSQKQSWRERISSFPSLRRSRRKTSSLPRSRSHEEFRSLLTPKKSSSSSPASSISSPSASSSSIVSIRRSKTSASLQSLYLAASPSNHQSLDLLNINKTNERDNENDSEEEKDIVCYNDDKRDNYNDINNKKSYRKASSVPATHRDQATSSSSSPSSPASSSSSPSSSQLTSKRHSLPAPFSSSSPLSLFSSFSSSYSTLFGDYHQRKEKQTKQETTSPTAPLPPSSNRLREGERSGIYRYKVSSATSSSTAAHSSSSIPSTSSLLAKVKGATNNRKKRRKRKEQLQQQQQRSHKEKSYSLEL